MDKCVENIKIYQIKQNLTLDDIAKKLQISRSGLYKKMSGRNEFTISEAKKILSMLGMKFEEVF